MLSSSFAHMWRNPERKWWWRLVVLGAATLALLLVLAILFCIEVTKGERDVRST